VCLVRPMKLSWDRRDAGCFGPSQSVSWLLIDPFLSPLWLYARHTAGCQYITRYAPLSARLIGGHLSKAPSMCCQMLRNRVGMSFVWLAGEQKNQE